MRVLVALVVGSLGLSAAQTCNDEFQIEGFEDWRGFGLENFPCNMFASTPDFRHRVCFGDLGDVIDPRTGVKINHACCVCPSPTPTASPSMSTSISSSASSTISFTASLTSSASFTSSHTATSSLSISATRSISISASPSLPPCEDDDALIVAIVNEEFEGRITINGCRDVDEFCDHGLYGPTLQAVCPSSCNQCPSSSPTASPSPSVSPVVCADDHSRVVDLAAEEGFTISGCGDVVSPINFCNFGPYRTILHEVCAFTCHPACECEQCAIDGECRVDQDQQVAIIAGAAGFPFQTCAEANAAFSCDDPEVGSLLLEFCPCTCSA